MPVGVKLFVGDQSPALRVPVWVILRLVRITEQTNGIELG
jgi:hypothetical protein